jgi:hypothetical protein
MSWKLISWVIWEGLWWWFWLDQVLPSDRDLGFFLYKMILQSLQRKGEGLWTRPSDCDLVVLSKMFQLSNNREKTLFLFPVFPCNCTMSKGYSIFNVTFWAWNVMKIWFLGNLGGFIMMMILTQLSATEWPRLGIFLYKTILQKVGEFMMLILTRPSDQDLALKKSSDSYSRSG